MCSRRRKCSTFFYFDCKITLFSSYEPIMDKKIDEKTIVGIVIGFNVSAMQK